MTTQKTTQLRLIDLSHVLDQRVPRFGAFPPPVITPFWTHHESALSGRYHGCTCEVTQVQFVTSLGTYMDAPFHFDPKGVDISGLTLEQCIAPGICVDVSSIRPPKPITAADLAGLDLARKAVLLYTGWSIYWPDPDTYAKGPFLSGDAARHLVDREIKLLGIDALVVDDTSDPRRPVHDRLLRAGVPIVENLTNLDQLLGRRFTFYAVPPGVRGAAAFPVRAFAVIEE